MRGWHEYTESDAQSNLASAVLKLQGAQAGYVTCLIYCLTPETLTQEILGGIQESEFLTIPQESLVLTVCNGNFQPYKIRENRIRLPTSPSPNFDRRL